MCTRVRQLETHDSQARRPAVRHLYTQAVRPVHDHLGSASRLHGEYFPPYVRALRSFFACPPQIRASLTLNHLPPACPRLGHLDGFFSLRVGRVPTTLTFSRRRRPFGWNVHCYSVSARLVTTSTPRARLQPRRARCPNPDSSDSTFPCRSLRSRQDLDSQRRP